MRMLMMSVAGMVAFSALPYAADAELVTLTKSSDTGFDEAYGWDSGKAPEEGNDYLVANGYYLRGDYGEGFAGDSLQFGVVGGSFIRNHCFEDFIAFVANTGNGVTDGVAFACPCNVASCASNSAILSL